jgi:hypothetical protein
MLSLFEEGLFEEGLRSAVEKDMTVGRLKFLSIIIRGD